MIIILQAHLLEKFYKQLFNQQFFGLKEYKIVQTDWLKPIEKVFNSHLEELERSILVKIQLTTSNYRQVSGAVLDGSHRYALIKHGYENAPALR